MFECASLDIKGQRCKFYRFPRSTIEDKKEYYPIQHKIVCLCNGDWLISCALRNESLCIFLDGQASQYSKECMKSFVCPDGDWFKLNWYVDSSRVIVNKTNYICRAFHSASKQILASQE